MGAEQPQRKASGYTASGRRQPVLPRRYADSFSETGEIPWYAHLQLYVMLSLIGIFIVWAALTKLDEVARGEGKVIPASEVQVVQSLEGGIIEELLVSEGAAVRAGQPLVKIRDVQAKSDFSAIYQKYLGLQASTARLRAEAEARPLQFTGEVQNQAPDVVRAETDAFHADMRDYDGQMGVLDQQLLQKQQEEEEAENRIADTAKVFSLKQEERNMVAPLVGKGSASKMELLKLDQDLAERQAELNALNLSLPKLKAAVGEVQGRITELQNSFRAAAQKQLAEKTAEMNTLKESISAFQDKSERSEIRSPVAGTVKDIKITTVGGVAKPGETIMEIVPSEDKLLIEARIKPSDIAFIHPGLKAIVRLTAFDFGIFGSFEGEVVDISADSIANDRGESFYRVKIRTDKTQIEKDGTTYTLIPGMQATVDIVTGRKSVMTYLLKPFIKASQTAFRER